MIAPMCCAIHFSRVHTCCSTAIPPTIAGKWKPGLTTTPRQVTLQNMYIKCTHRDNCSVCWIRRVKVPLKISKEMIKSSIKLSKTGTTSSDAQLYKRKVKGGALCLQVVKPYPPNTTVPLITQQAHRQPAEAEVKERQGWMERLTEEGRYKRRGKVNIGQVWKEVNAEVGVKHVRVQLCRRHTGPIVMILRSVGAPMGPQGRLRPA